MSSASCAALRRVLNQKNRTGEKEMSKILDDETVCHVFNCKSKQDLIADASQSALFHWLLWDFCQRQPSVGS